MSTTTTTIAPAELELSRLEPAKTHPPRIPGTPPPDLESHTPPPGATIFTAPTARSVYPCLLACNSAMFLGGLNDAATGALVPYLQPSYHIGLLFVALVYLINFTGWLTAAFSNVHVTARLGSGGAMLLGAALQAAAHALQFWRPPFPLFVASYFVAGLGVALQDAQANTFVGGVQRAHRHLGVLHAVYGVGAIVAPLAATAIAAHNPDDWHYFYALPFGVAILHIALVTWAFWSTLGNPPKVSHREAQRDMHRTLKSKPVLVLAAFFFLYVGTEVTAGGWVVEFLIRERGGAPSQMGYVASGFWAGLTLGRVVLAEPTHRLGARRMVFAYLFLAIVAQLVFWFVPHILTNAIMISLLGFLIGPFFPTGISVATRLLPREMHVAAIGFVAVFGQGGSAAFPFLTGAVAARVGVKVLQPVLVGLLVGMVGLWWAVPRVKEGEGEEGGEGEHRE
ncbi:major facilitator superfamily domain-containing protein [Geopyxis carbonaria]|nr:major facilitator superfamily domain-containing protein [Geopyxis carbonaria]